MLRVLLYLIPLALAIFALVDCIQTPDEDVRGLPKLGWIVLILLFWVIGPVAWLIAGRSRNARPRRRAPWPSGPTSGFPEYERPGRRSAAPDDDDDFLSELERRRRAQQPPRDDPEGDGPATRGEASPQS